MLYSYQTRSKVFAHAFIAQPSPMTKPKTCFAQIATIVSLIALLTACTNNHPENTANRPTMSAETPALLRSPKDSLNYGRDSAAYRHLARTWQIKAINDLSINRQAILDLQNIMHGKGTLTLQSQQSDCNITLHFNTQNISTGTLHTQAITHQHAACLDDFEQQLIKILNNINYIEYFNPDSQDDNACIILRTYQDKLLLAPTP